MPTPRPARPRRRGRGRSRAPPVASRRRRRARPRRFRHLRRRAAGRSRARRADRPPRQGGRARTTSCGSRASSTSPASRCGCWCRASARASARNSTARWGAGEPRQSRLVVIGERGLDREAIAAALWRLNIRMHVLPHRDADARRGRVGRRSRPVAGGSSCSSPSPTATSGARRACDAVPEPSRACGSRASRACAIRCRSTSMSRASCARAQAGDRARASAALDYWRYGVDELGALARGAASAALLPGDGGATRGSMGLDAAGATRLRIWRYFARAARTTWRRASRFLASGSAPRRSAPPPVAESAPSAVSTAPRSRRRPEAPRALIVFYRSIFLAGDLAPVDALARGAARQGLRGHARLRDQPEGRGGARAARAPSLDGSALRRRAQHHRLLRAPGMSDGTALDRPTRRCCRSCWRASAASLARVSARPAPADLAMNVVLPELDGRLLSRAISFKAASATDARTEFAAVVHRPLADRVDFVAELARRWARLGARRRGTGALALRPAGLSGARRPHRLCGRARYAGERRRHLRDPGGGGLRCRPRGSTRRR